MSWCESAAAPPLRSLGREIPAESRDWNTKSTSSNAHSPDRTEKKRSQFSIGFGHILALEHMTKTVPVHSQPLAFCWILRDVPFHFCPPPLAPPIPSRNDIPMIAFLETFSQLFYERIGLLVGLLIIGISALSPSFRGLLRLKS